MARNMIADGWLGTARRSGSTTEEGDSGAQHNLAMLYRDGIGLVKAYVQALIWYSVSASMTGDPKTIFQRDALETRMTPQAVKTARKLAADFTLRYYAKREQNEPPPAVN